MSIGTALLRSDGQLLLKFLGGAAYQYAPNVHRITHYTPLVPPAFPA